MPSLKLTEETAVPLDPGTAMTRSVICEPGATMAPSLPQTNVTIGAVGSKCGVILTAAGNQGTVGRGAVLLAFYSAGLAIPFLLCALAMSAMTRFFKFFRNHYRVITVVAGVILIAMGVMLYTNDITRLNSWANDIGLNLISGV